jgi:thiol-disulfide isomerase/thioredoxin
MGTLKPLAADVLGGLILGAALVFDGVVALQSRTLVYLFFLLPAVLAGVVGFWRGRRGSWPLPVDLLVLNLPISGLAIYLGASEGAWTALAVPAVTWLVTAFGLRAGRGQPTPGASPALAIGGALLGIAVVALTIAVHPIVGTFIAQKVSNEAAPNFQLAMLDGGTIPSQALRGKVVVLDFWTSWCQPCRHEFPELEKVYARYRGRPDIAFFAVDGDRGDTPDNARRFFREAHYSLPVAYDHGSKVYEAFSAPGFPTLVVIDRDGRLRFRHTGFLGAEDFAGDLTRLIDGLLQAS